MPATTTYKSRLSIFASTAQRFGDSPSTLRDDRTYWLAALARDSTSVSYCSAELDIYRTDYPSREFDGFQVIANSALA